MVLTHGHSDHLGGLAAILDDFRPKELWIGPEPDSVEWRGIKQHADAAHVRVVSMNNATPAKTVGGTRFRALYPPPDYAPADTAKNNDSLVLELDYGSRSVLLTGDAERQAEAELAGSGELHPVTLLKVGHHGSRTSSSEEFLAQTQPQFAFISDGYKNQFHHPSPEVLARLAEHHTAIFRTDQRGLLTFLTDGETVHVQPFR